MDSRYLITTAELAELLDEVDVRVVDMRWSLDDDDRGERDYKAGHIPGAVYVHWLRDISDPDDPVAGQIAPEQRFSSAMSDAGIGNDTLVVVYDDGEILMAPRLLWALHFYGHEKVRVLDGGWQAWRDEDRPIEKGVPQSGSSVFQTTVRPDLRAVKTDVLNDLHGTSAILDCRMDETWNESLAHIPGAQRFPAPELLDAQGRYLSEDLIRTRAASLGLDPERRIVLYCGGGVSASAAYLALSAAGYTNLTMYDGSWSEWGEDLETPKQAHTPLTEGQP